MADDATTGPAARSPPVPPPDATPPRIEVCGHTLSIEAVLGGGQYGSGAFAARCTVVREPSLAKGDSVLREGDSVVVKQTKDHDEPSAQELALELRIHKVVHAAWQQHGRFDDLAVPEIFHATPTQIVMSLMPGIPLQDHLGVAKRHDAADACEVAATNRLICEVALRALAALLLELRDISLSHRDMTDNNVMVALRTPVTSAADVKVGLIDFGRSMASCDGQMVSAGMFNRDGSRPATYNPTADPMRFVMSVQRTLYSAYEQGAQGDGWAWKRGTPFPNGGVVPDAFLEAELPFAGLVDGWLEHVRVVLPEAYEKASAVGIPPTFHAGIGIGFVGFTRTPFYGRIRQLQLPYAVLTDAAKLYDPLMPERLIGASAADDDVIKALVDDMEHGPAESAVLERAVARGLPVRLTLGLSLEAMEAYVKALPDDLVEQANSLITRDASGDLRFPINANVNGYVNQLYLEEQRKADHISWCERMVRDGQSGVGVATIFVSWFLDTPLETLLDALREHLRVNPNLPPETKFWVCDFAIRQNTRGLPHMFNDVKRLGDCVRAVCHTLLLMQPWYDPGPLKRVYCIKELHHTLASNATLNFVMTSSQRGEFEKALVDDFKSISEHMSSVDVRKASCRVAADKVSVLKELDDDVGLGECNVEVVRGLQQHLAMQGLAALGKLTERERGESKLINQLIRLLRDQGKYEGALKLAREALAAKREIYGPQHKFTLVTLGNLVQVLTLMGQLNEAQTELGDAESVALEVLGEEHVDFLILKTKVAHMKYLRGHGSVPLSTALTNLEAELGPTHHETVKYRAMQAKVLADINSLPQSFAVSPVVVRPAAGDKMEALIVPKLETAQSFTGCGSQAELLFVAFLRDVIKVAEDWLKLTDYQMRLCTTMAEGGAPAGHALGIAKLEDVTAAAAAAAGYYVLLVGSNGACSHEPPRAPALEAMDSPIEYEDGSGKFVKLDLCQRDLLVTEGEHARVVLDAQARPMYVAVLKRFVRRQTDCTDAELAELWRLPLQQAAMCGGIINARINAGGFQNVAHMHLKCIMPQGPFQETWAGSPVYEHLAKAAKASGPKRLRNDDATQAPRDVTRQRSL